MATQPSAGEVLDVVIVGGGTAGWMTAAALAVLLSRGCRVHLVESETIGIIGVGEATLPHMRAFNQRIGIDEATFIAATRATFKLGIEFRDWARIGDSYIHPFGTYGSGQGAVDFHHYWSRLVRSGKPVPPIEAFSFACALARQNRFAPPSRDPASIASTYDYAYQFDAQSFAPLLRYHAEAAGVRRSEGIVAGVDLDGESGFIRQLTLADGRVIAGDLFVDCSGFRARLIEGALDEPYEDWSRHLPCDRAVAMPCRTETAITPFTSAIAERAGWRWRIPLQHRTGNGYVYSSAHLSDEAAERRLVGVVEGDALADPRILHFRAGRRRRSWVGNCVAIGLASGFLEPLESTSIYLVQAAITALLELFPSREIAATDRDEFNRLIDLEYDRVRDFLILHYQATFRDDAPFWHDVRATPMPDSLVEKIELFRERGTIARYSEGIFRDASWIAVFTGQGIIPSGGDRRAAHPPLDTVAQAMAKLRHQIGDQVACAPYHADFLARERLMVAA